jgi:cytoskeletal protein CcmA (bactofilin family)
MFGNNSKNNFMTKKTEIDTGSINTLGTGTSVNGDIVTNGDIRINGNLTGNIQAKGKVVIGPSGFIDGNISCQTADVYGKINGNVTSSDILSLKATANITGDVSAGKLSIEPGAAFTGACSMGAVVKDIKNGESAKERKTEKFA